MFTKLIETIESLDLSAISDERKAQLQPLVDYIGGLRKQGKKAHLNFICTHNSRRSQLSQVWATVAALYYNVNAHCYSGGTEVTACYPSTIKALERSGFVITADNPEASNPTYKVNYADETEPVVVFSKLYNDSSSPTEDFAAIMTCANAEKSCPVIPQGTIISLRYEDPKIADGTEYEIDHYHERSLQIATELLYVFKQASE